MARGEDRLQKVLAFLVEIMVLEQSVALGYYYQGSALVFRILWTMRQSSFTEVKMKYHGRSRGKK